MLEEARGTPGGRPMAYEILKPASVRPIRGVLFDMDGVVLDSERLYNRFWREAALELGHPMTWEQALGMRSLNRIHGQKYLDSCFGPGVDYEKMRSIRIRRMDAWVEEHGVAPKPGICELLDYLQSRWLPCAITTSSPPDRVKAHLTPLGLYDRFQAICSGYELEHGKPEPDIYLYGASCIHLDPRDCLAVEDSAAGIESAFRAGCLPVIVPDQDQPSEETLSRSFAKADSLSDLCALLDQLNQN